MKRGYFMFTSGFWVSCAVVALFSYLLGSLNFGIIVSKVLLKDDVRRHGSGNAGMTNVLRTYGKKPAALTTVGDFSKGAAAILAARLLFNFLGHPASYAGYVAGLFVLLGHLFPLCFRFKGGKGALTTLGIMFMLNPLVFGAVCLIFIPMVFLTKIVSLTVISGAAAFPVFTFAIRMLQGRPFAFETIFAALMGIIVIIVHKDNIRRLLSGTEYKFGGRKK